jgi:hypothetical protein
MEIDKSKVTVNMYYVSDTLLDLNTFHNLVHWIQNPALASLHVKLAMYTDKIN